MVRIRFRNNVRIASNASKIPVYLFCIFFLLSVHSFSQVSIKITAIGESKTTETEIWVTEKEDISGSIRFDEDDGEDILLQIAWRRAGDDTWWIHKQTIPFQANLAKTHPWNFRGVLLGSEFDYKKTLEIVAFAVPKGEPLPEGIIDYNSLVYLSRAISNQVSVFRKGKTHGRFLVTPRIRIASIDEKAVKARAIYEVGLKALLKGEARKPTDSKIRLVAQPLGSDQYWVMEEEPLIRQGHWSGKMDFVSYGLDTESEFVIFAIITQSDIPQGRPIFQEEWQLYLQTAIISISTIFRVTRVEIPLGKNQIGVKILVVDDLPMNFTSDWEVRPRSNVKGILLGRPLKFDEAVWVLVASEFDDGSWRILGKASLKNGRFWELSPQLLGESGDYLKLIAVIAGKDAVSLNKEKIDESIAFSRPVQVRTQNTPPIIVRIKRVDKQTVGNEEDLSVSHISSVEGSISGRPLATDDKVWILKTPDDDGQTWQLLGRAGFKNKRDWALPPISLGDSGDELVLVAVVAKNQISNMDVKSHGDILAASDKVRVRLTD